MTKLLYLLRHAQSAEKQQGQTDRERELTQQGVKESFQIGAFMHREKIFPDAIYCSVAERARMCAQLIADTIKLDLGKIIPDEELFQASVRTFMEFVQRLDDSYKSVMCIGHNPAISYLAEYLSKAEIGELPTGGLVILKFPIDNWEDVNEGTGEFIQLVTPTMLTAGEA
ncbi:MAG TPA: histidine phosphatase family protein [Cyclobacteriaceae bacterium]|nr:histidine phosphatase family protein [Cyclobacteriaceae bacterium]